jgi:diaminohydroxyphosphoribosylaminopyrimidine deaminase/5-amino-6-(5-phosphoribosylamino)uracil reductase
MMNERLTTDELYINRCIELAKLGAGRVAPNPMVGAVLVYEGMILGEGYHEQFGKAHAEVNCINSVPEAHQHLIPDSTLYVSLEPCAHHGKTPPCTDLIIRNNIKKVVIGTRDPFSKVNGKGIEKLQSAGVHVVTGVQEQACNELNKRFFTFHQKKRPYVILKWAQTADGRISSGNENRLLISNELTNREVHKWRSEEASILVGTNTALLDDPALNVRLWKGNNPVRLVMDLNLRLPSHLQLFDQSQPTVVFNFSKHEEVGTTSYYKLTPGENIIDQVMDACYQLNIQSLLVEGGAKLLQSFIDTGNWDEARVITNPNLSSPGGLPAPVLNEGKNTYNNLIASDLLAYFRNLES